MPDAADGGAWADFWGRAPRVMKLAVPSAGEALLGMLVGLVNTYLVGHLGAA